MCIYQREILRTSCLIQNSKMTEFQVLETTGFMRVPSKSNLVLNKFVLSYELQLRPSKI